MLSVIELHEETISELFIRNYTWRLKQVFDRNKTYVIFLHNL